MNCPHCDKQINGMTGLQELQKFHKHLHKCKKNPNRVVMKVEAENGSTKLTIGRQTMMDALNIRADSGQ